MLQIRDEQMRAFDDVAEAAFVSRLVETIRQRHSKCPVLTMNGEQLVDKLSPETLRHLVTNGVKRARRYGLSFENSLALFVILMFETAPNFDRHPLVERILRDERTEPNKRTARMLDEVTEQNWAAVRLNYDPSAWGLTIEPKAATAGGVHGD